MMVKVFPNSDIVTSGSDWNWRLWHRDTDTSPDRFTYWWHLGEPLADEPFDPSNAETIHYNPPFSVFRGIYQYVLSGGFPTSYGFSANPFVVGMPQVVPSGSLVKVLIHHANNSANLLGGSPVTWRFVFSPNSDMSAPTFTHEVTLAFPPSADLSFLENISPSISWRYVSVSIVDPVISGPFLPPAVGVEVPHVGVHALWAEVEGRRIVPRRTLLGASV
jgi:hypothetical protein